MRHYAAGHTSSVLPLGIAICLVVAIMPGTGRSDTGNSTIQKVSELETIRGVVRPAAQAVLSSQIEGRISRLPFKEGQRFRRGNTLVHLDCAKYEAELAAARAEHEARTKTLQNNLGLSRLDAIGSLEVDISKAEARKALAGILIAKVKVNGCRIKAPFSGRIVKVMVNEHENVFPNDQLISILNDNRLEIELILPSKALAWLKKGASFNFAVDETGRSYVGVLKELGASVDPVSQTIRVTGEFRKTPRDVLAGMSGTATFPAALPQDLQP